MRIQILLMCMIIVEKEYFPNENYSMEIQFGSWEHMLLPSKNVFANVKKKLKQIDMFIVTPKRSYNL